LTVDDARGFALALPEATEEPHFELSSFRVRKKIFATVSPDGSRLHVFVDEHGVRAAVGLDPSAFEELWWGKRLAGVRVVLERAEPDVVCDLLETSWRTRAPKSLVRAWEEERGRLGR
jgi:hypothetical protein